MTPWSLVVAMEMTRFFFFCLKFDKEDVVREQARVGALSRQSFIDVLKTEELILSEMNEPVSHLRYTEKSRKQFLLDHQYHHNVVRFVRVSAQKSSHRYRLFRDNLVNIMLSNGYLFSQPTPPKPCDSSPKYQLCVSVCALNISFAMKSN